MDTADIANTANVANSRVTRWTQKLLDLSLRNRLLNTGESKQILPLAGNDPSGLENRLADGRSLPVTGAASAADAGSLQTTLGPEETTRRLKELYRIAKTDLEESGVGTLYLALGFLKWRPAAANARDYRAPILLVPVELTRRSVREGYALSRRDEDTELNATLLEFLRSQFGIVPAGIDPLPEDAAGVAVDQVLAALREAVRGQEGWDVEPTAALGRFSFGKFVMWKDLSFRAEALAAHPLVAHLMRGGGDYDDGITVFPPEEIAAQIEYGRLFCPLSADSSQLTAVLYSAAGTSFVLHGPPGTGKSQTITNLIAHNLALGRRVLFVAEKKAALDVVHRRLAAIGLRPFCLELHSNRSGKAEVLEQFREALDFADRGVPNEWQPTVDQIALYRDELDAPVAALHHRYPCGLTPYDCFARQIAPGPGPVAIGGGKCAERTVAEVAAARDAVRDLAGDFQGTTMEAVRALAMVRTFVWSPTAAAAVKSRLAALRATPAWRRGFAALCRGFGLKGFRRGFAAALEAALAAMDESRGVMRYRSSRAAVCAHGGEAIAAALEAGEVESAAALELFDRSFAAQVLKEILHVEQRLAGFAGLKREENMLEFRRLDGEYLELVRHVVRTRLAAAMPGGRLGDCPEGSELGVIRRECAKKARQKPVRQLLAQTRGVTAALKPCFLMSPLSVAQYLPPEAEFDLVVFDEASQIPVWDAVGVIARAKQCVVVGDPKQMPPTDFFHKSEGEAEEGEDEDLESILDECLAAGLGSAHLSWHYRSRHESLIAFSNHHYYGDRLCTFPAAKSTPRLGVRHCQVPDGVYDAKASRTNAAEARALVDYVFERLADPAWPRRSVGVVTFSIAQKELIEDLFEERRRACPGYEDFFAAGGEEPFFVKNLENVQGDERDVILFSVGYAKDPDGRFRMNFGPLNRAGGERRLNVAVTRAREQVVVFASCRSEEIDLDRTQAVGAAHLKAFLAYAERGGIPAAADRADSERDRFAAAVAACLREHGYETELGVGCSGYRIDIGVKDPEVRGAYLAAIECDGETYAAAATARDRDRLRADVLHGLGWNTIRVWAADWALDRERAEARLIAELEAARRSEGHRLPVSDFRPSVTFPRRRAVKETPPEKRTPLESVSRDELRRTMADVERDLGRCDRDTLYREVAKRYGYKTVSPKARARLDTVRWP